MAVTGDERILCIHTAAWHPEMGEMDVIGQPLLSLQGTQTRPQQVTVLQKEQMDPKGQREEDREGRAERDGQKGVKERGDRKTQTPQ